MDTVLRNIRYAARQLRRGGASTLVATLTVAVGIAVATVMMSVVDLALLRPLPYRASDRLMSVQMTTVQDRGKSPHGSLVQYATYQSWKTESKLAEAVAAWTNDFATLDINGELQVKQLFLITSDLFAFLGAKPMLGRTFMPEEEQQGAAPVAILSHEFWLRSFGGDSNAIGHSVKLNDARYTIVGVMPKAFTVPNADADGGAIFLPMGSTFGSQERLFVNVLAILKRGVTTKALETELDRTINTVPAAISNPVDGRPDYRVTQVFPLRDQLIAELRKPLVTLIGAVLCVLLIICANIAGMQLTRLAARRQEFALRMTLGASRGSIGQLVFIENILLAVAGGAIGIMLAVAMFPSVIALFGSELPTYGTIGLDLRVLAMVTMTIVAMGILFGGVSVWIASTNNQRTGVSDGHAGSGTSRGRITAGNAIVVGEIALTMVMLGFTGLLTRSYLQLTGSERGYNPHGAITTSVAMPDAKAATPMQKHGFADEIVKRVEQLPGVTYAAASLGAPLTSTYSAKIEVVASDGKTESFKSQAVFGTPQYFGAVGLRLIQGRYPTVADANQAFVIDEAAAKLFFGSTNPIGKILRMTKDSLTGTIVGVVRNTSEIVNSSSSRRVRSITPHVFAPYPAASSFTLVARTNGNVHTLSGAIKGSIHEYSPRAIVDEPRELQATTYKWFSHEGVLTGLSVTFAILGLIIAAGGLYAIISYGASQRTREFGIRIALGAQSVQITALTLQRGISLAVAGAAIGLVATVAMSRVVRSMLFEVSPVDPLSLFVSGSVLLFVALIASYVPAQRATRVEVVTALREQ